VTDEARPFLDRGASFEGKLTFSGTLRIDGQLRGEARSKGRLVVGEPGIVQADVEVGDLIVLGTVVGAVRARGSVRVASTGRLEGNVEAKTLSIEDGAYIEARIRMTEPGADLAKAGETEEKVPETLPGR
jgi:cytoskeletal protein CcmA (bactofilin family)